MRWRSADVGDDVYGEDPTVNALEALAAQRLGFAASLFVPSGTMSNLLALLTHCGRGDEYIAGQQAHTYKYEGGGGAVLGGIQPQPLPFQQDGTLDLDVVEATVKPDDFHFARTRLLCLENTLAGAPLPLGYTSRARALCDRHGMRMHLDGARIFNAAIAQRVPVTQLTAGFDSVSVCLSKGLGAPVGSVLCGSEEFVRARATLAQNARRRHAPGRRPRGGRHTRAEPSCRPAGRRSPQGCAIGRRAERTQRVCRTRALRNEHGVRRHRAARNEQIGETSRTIERTRAWARVGSFTSTSTMLVSIASSNRCATIRALARRRSRRLRR